MSDEPEQSSLSSEEQQMSKKAAKKQAAKEEKMRRRQQEQSLNSASSSSSAVVTINDEEEEEDPHGNNYGEVLLQELKSSSDPEAGNWSRAINGKEWTEVSALVAELKDNEVLIRGRVHTTRPVSKTMAFLVVREKGFTIQCLATIKFEGISAQMIKFVAGLNRESIVDVIGVVSVPDKPINSTTQQVEIQVRKLYCVNKALPKLPFDIEDAARSEIDLKKASLQEGEQFVRVNQDTRLKYRVLDIRTAANQGIFRIQGQVGRIFRDFLLSDGFVEIHTPKLIEGSSEGGAAIFKLEYKGKARCLAQSPQLYKQMSICGDFGKVFEIGPVFRAEDSSTHRHLCEFTGLDMEMEIRKHYSEVMDVVDKLFVAMFDSLNQTCKKELEAVGRQYPFVPLKYLPKTLRLTFEEGVQMLKDAGVEIDPLGDLNTESERKLGQLVLEKYGTEFYILHRYPLAVRPFYTMPCYDNTLYSNSFDVFIRGEEIISGAQRVHVPELLSEQAKARGIDVNTISTYVDSFRYGAPPHGGFGVGLERVVMLFCGLNNIRKTSLYPRDPQRLAP